MTSVFSLPRYITLKPDDGHTSYLKVDVTNGIPYLRFTAEEQTRLASHEVVYNTDVANVLMIRSPNGRFWRRNASGWIVADREQIPDPSADKDCYFRVTGLTSNIMVFQSIVDDLYIKRFTSSITNGLSANTSTVDRHARMHVIAADDAAITLPRYIMLFGDNNMYVGDHRERNIDWLKFNKDSPRLACAHEVIPLLNGDLMIRNMNLNKFWRRSPNWIWADRDLADALQNIDCHFDVLKLSSTMVAFISMANQRLLKRYTEYWESCLCAIGTTTNDITTRLILSEALLSRSLFNIRYLLELAEVTDMRPVLVGSGSMLNSSGFTTSLEVTVVLSQTVTTSETWSTSSTFSTSLTVGFSVGVPEVASVNGSVTIGHEKTVSTEMGKTTEYTLQFQTTYKVDNVPSGVEVRVTVECTTAKLRLPFTYRSRDARIDGIYLPIVDNVDGIFEGVSAFNIRGVVSTVGGDIATKTLPVDVQPVPA